MQSYEKALELTQSRYHGGLASAVDVAQAQTILDTTRAEATDVGVQRAVFEHAIAVLIGKPASQFSLPQIPLTAPPPVIPSGVPSDLLERRPDISAAERRVQEQNAQIGDRPRRILSADHSRRLRRLRKRRVHHAVARAQRFLDARRSDGPKLCSKAARRRRGASDQAKAAWNQSVDNYRQTVLVAFEEVEDNLAALRI